MIHAYVLIEAEPTRVQELVEETARHGVGWISDYASPRGDGTLRPDRVCRKP